jgi:hypothetical protein
MICLSVQLAASLGETWFVMGKSVAYGEAGTSSGQTMGIGAFGVLVEIGMVLTKVSDVYDEVVEMQNDCPKESDDAREICRDILHVHDPVPVPHRVCRHRAHGGVGRLSVFCQTSASAPFF